MGEGLDHAWPLRLSGLDQAWNVAAKVCTCALIGTKGCPRWDGVKGLDVPVALNTITSVLRGRGCRGTRDQSHTATEILRAIFPDAGNVPPPGTFCLLKLPDVWSLVVKSEDTCLPVSICTQEAAEP